MLKDLRLELDEWWREYLGYRVHLEHQLVSPCLKARKQLLQVLQTKFKLLVERKQQETDLDMRLKLASAIDHMMSKIEVCHTSDTLLLLLPSI